MLKIRDAAISDLDRIMEIYRYAQDHMIRSGNPDQWGHFYPDPELIRSDIESGACKLLCDQDRIHGVFAVFEGEEPTYQYIENGRWLNHDPYITMHRMAGDGEVHGLFRCALDHCRSIAQNIRVDTHEKNTTMQKLIEKSGFIKCGTIYVSDGTPRLAYHWTAIPQK